MASRQRIIAFAGRLIGHVRGGLGQVNIAGLDAVRRHFRLGRGRAAAVGGMMIPQMKARGYGADYAVNVTVDGRADRAAAARPATT